MSRLIHQKIAICALCPYHEVEENDCMMITIYCMHSENETMKLYSDNKGDSWKAHKEIHPSCPLPLSD